MPPDDDSSLHFEWHGERLCLFADKALFWERESMLVVSDLHFGKEAAFRRAGRARAGRNAGFRLGPLGCVAETFADEP